LAVGAVLGAGLLLVFLGTRSLIARTLTVLFLVALGLVAARLLWPRSAVEGVFDYTVKEALLPEWDGVRKLDVDLITGELSLRPGRGALWVEKAATTRRQLEDLELEILREGDVLRLHTSGSAQGEPEPMLRLALEVPGPLDRLSAESPPGGSTLRVVGLSLPEVELNGPNLSALGTQVGELRVETRTGWVRFEGGVVGRIVVEEWQRPLLLQLEGIEPGPEGTLVTSSRELYVELRLVEPFRLEVVVPPGGDVDLSTRPEARWEELPDGGKLWTVGDESLPPIRLELPEGDVNLVVPIARQAG